MTSKDCRRKFNSNLLPDPVVSRPRYNIPGREFQTIGRELIPAEMAIADVFPYIHHDRE